jgi:hypothetical protein
LQGEEGAKFIHLGEISPFSALRSRIFAKQSVMRRISKVSYRSVFDWRCNRTIFPSVSGRHRGPFPPPQQFHAAGVVRPPSPNPERAKANLRNLADQGRGLSGGDILNICLNALHAGSRDPDPAKWLVTEELLLLEIRPAKVAKEKHSCRGAGRRRIGLHA